MSASAWHGWYRSLSALITGNIATISRVRPPCRCVKTRATIPFVQRSRLRATSLIGSRSPIRPVGGDRIAAELLDGEFEGQPGSERRLFEQQSKVPPGQRASEPGRISFYLTSKVEQRYQLIQGEILVAGQVAGGDVPAFIRDKCGQRRILLWIFIQAIE